MLYITCVDEVNFLSCLSWHNSSGNIVFCCQLFLYPFAFIIPVTRRVNGVYQIRREVSNMWRKRFRPWGRYIYSWSASTRLVLLIKSIYTLWSRKRYYKVGNATFCPLHTVRSCYILFDNGVFCQLSSIPLYCTSNGYKIRVMGIKKMKNFFYMFDKTAPKHNTFKCCFVFKFLINATKRRKIPHSAVLALARLYFVSLITAPLFLWTFSQFLVISVLVVK